MTTQPTPEAIATLIEFLAEEANRNAWLQHVNGDYEQPFIEVAGVKAFVFVDERGRYRVSMWDDRDGQQFWSNVEPWREPKLPGIPEGPQRPVHMVLDQLDGWLLAYERADDQTAAINAAERIARDARELLDRLRLRAMSAETAQEASEWLAVTLHGLDVAAYQRDGATHVHLDPSAGLDLDGPLVVQVGDSTPQRYGPDGVSTGTKLTHPVDALPAEAQLDLLRRIFNVLEHGNQLGQGPAGVESDADTGMEIEQMFADKGITFTAPEV